jgi:hypothetical protein
MDGVRNENGINTGWDNIKAENRNSNEFSSKSDRIAREKN